MTNRPIANGNLRRGIPAAALIGVPLLVIAIALLLTQQVSRADRLYAAERQSQERRALLQAVLSAHQDIETGQRGYLLTGRAEFLEPRVAGDRRVRSAVASLRSAYVGDRASLAVIDQIDGDSRAKRRFVERTIARRAVGDPTGATALVNSGRGKRLMPRAEVEPVGELGQPVLIVSDRHTPELDAKLRSKGLRPVIANSADSAAAQLQRERYRAALVDISLGTMDTVIRAARSAGPNLHMPIVAIGGEPRDGEVPGAPALIVDWLHDAIPATDIAERLKQAIGTTGKGRCRVLHVDDDPDVLRVVAAALEHAADVTSSPSLATARSALQASEFDLVILDLTLGDGRGSELFPDLQRAGQPPVPVVAFSAEDPDSHTASQFQHFLTKGRTPLEHLVQVIVSVAQTIAPAQRT